MTFNGEDIWPHLLGKVFGSLVTVALSGFLWSLVVTCLQICVESQGDGGELEGKAEVGAGKQVGKPWT